MPASFARFTVLFFACAIVCCTNSIAQVPASVAVTGGLVSGVADAGNGLIIYKGIPFAAPPTGNLRWKAPQPVKPWKGILKCTNFGPAPMQASPVPFSMWSQEWLIPAKPISEDCLYLNVWTGAKDDADKRPVLVWIYGGGFSGGGAAVPIYDGAALAKKGIVVVSLQYRVGIFGFLSLPELSKESPEHVSGNYGLMDQVAALEWVKSNIKNFGGDPDRVTICGQSAGSMSVHALGASPRAKGLFRQMIAESGAMMLETPVHKNILLSEAEAQGKDAVRPLGDPGLRDLRRMAAGELMEKIKTGFGPVIDGWFLPSPPDSIYRAGLQNAATLLTGWNQEEGFVEKPLTAVAYGNKMRSVYGSAGDDILKYYPGETDSEATRSQIYFSRDLVFGIQNYTLANRQATDSAGRVYVYRFTRRPPATGKYVKYGAFHSGEVPYVFDNLDRVDRPWTETDRRLATEMSGYWVNFVRTGNPNGSGLPEWPLYKVQSKLIEDFGDETGATPMPDSAALDFLYSALTGEK